LTYLEPEKAALNLARVYRQRSKGAQALKMSNLALEANRYYQPAYIFKNQLLLGQGRLELAIGCLKQASSRLPKDPKILLALAKDYIRAGDISNARKCFHDILGIAPKSKQAKVARDYLALL
jgi:tetratricopeptide (TPR) repeat protein